MQLTYLTLLTKSMHLKVFGILLTRSCRTKNVLGETVIELDKTLLGRLMSYLNTKPNNCVNSGFTIMNNLIHGKDNSLRTLSIDQLAGVFYSVNTNVITRSKEKMIKVLDLLDVECCLRINSMDSSKILMILNAYMHVRPNRITEYKFYQYATDNFDRYIDQATQRDLLQFIFYMGLQKESKVKPILKKCLRKIEKCMLESLTIEDLCIICNSAYRTHMKISNVKLLNKIKETLNRNLYLLKDPALLVALIKTIKHNGCQDDDILSTIKCTIFFNKTSHYYSLPTMCHILSLYADVLYYEEDLLKLLMDKCINELRFSGNIKPRGTYLTEQFRPKDITRFLWILAILGFTEIEEQLLKAVIVPNIQKHLNAGKYNNHPEELTDAILYLRMLKYPAVELLHFALSPKNILHIKRTPSKHRLNLLLSIIKYEDEKLFKSLNIKQLEFASFIQDLQIEIRPELQKVFKTLKDISHNLNITFFQLNMQIPHLNIVGITAYKQDNENTKPKLVVNIEVLDDYNCVKNKDCWPAGYMKLKLRILEQLPVPLITIPRSDMEGLTEEELQIYLKDEFQLIVY